MKAKTKKPCEFEAMRDMTEILAPFRIEERKRIVDAVNAKLDARAEPKPRGRKPKSTVQVPA